MKRKSWLWLGLGLLIAIAIVGLSAIDQQLAPHPAQAQAPSPTVTGSPTSSPTTSPTLRPTPSDPTSPTPEPNPDSTLSPTPPSLPGFPTPLPTATAIPPGNSPNSLPIPPTQSVAPPASTASPLPLAEGQGQLYTDPAGRFKVGVLQGYTVSPLAGSVLVEAPNGSLAYAVVAQSQPTANPIGLVPTFLNVDALAQVATTVLQRGESFQPGAIRAEAGGGAVMDWTGTLTIAGKAQPVGGSILIRPTQKNILLLVLTATETGAGQVPGAMAALANTLQPI